MLTLLAALSCLSVSVNGDVNVPNLDSPTVPPPLAQYEGCFSDPGPLHRLPHSLSWQECVQFCDHRLNTHVGLQSDPSMDSYNYCYCGNRLTERLASVNDSECGLCEGVRSDEESGESEERRCGGARTVSLYTLRDSTPLTALFATPTGVFLYDFDNSSSTLLLSLENVKDVAYHFNQDAIFIKSRDRVYSSYYSPYTMEYSEPKVIFESTPQHYYPIDFMKNGLGVDWIRDKIYYTFNPHDGYGSNAIRRSDLEGIDVTRIISTGRSATAYKLAIDPNQGWLFYVEDGKLRLYSLDVDAAMAYSARLLDITRVSTVAVDTARSALYLAGQDSSSWYLGRVDYSGGTRGVKGTVSSEVRVVYRGPELADILDVAVFQDQVVWARAGQQDLYTCKLTPRCRTENINTFLIGEEIDALQIYHPVLQAADPCSEAGCSHSCSGGRCSCPSGKLLASDNRTCQAAPVRASYVGCFPAARAARRGLLSHLSLSWSQCLQLCDHRLSTHAGLEEDPSAESFVHCYCGDLAEPSAVLDDSLCPRCQEGEDDRCGEHANIAVYSLRETSPVALLLATDSGVKLLVSNQSSTSSLVDTSSPVTSVDYDYRNDEVYFVTNGLAQRTYYSPILTTFVPPSNFTSRTMVAALAVDWTTRDLIWEQDKRHYGSPIQTFFTDFRGKDKGKVIFDAGNKHPHDLALDSYKRLLFFIYKGIIHRYDMSAHKLDTFDNRELSLQSVSNISLDVVAERVYMLATEGGDQAYLASVTYSGQGKRVLYHGPQLKGAGGLAVLGGTVVWGAQGGRTLYQCHLTPRCLPENLTVIYQGLEKVNAFKMYHPGVQMLTPEEICTKLNCSHQCDTVDSAPGGAACNCPPSWSLAADNRTCTALTTTSVQDTPTTTSIPIELLPRQEETTTTEGEQGNTEMKLTTGQMKTTRILKNINTNKNTKSGLSFMDVFIVVGVVFVVVLLSVSICLQLRPRRAKGNFPCSYKPASEMEELSTCQFNI